MRPLQRDFWRFIGPVKRATLTLFSLVFKLSPGLCPIFRKHGSRVGDRRLFDGFSITIFALQTHDAVRSSLIVRSLSGLI